MSISTITVAVKSNTRGPEIGDSGYIGVANAEIEHIYNEEWGANFYTFGWIYSGLKSISLITKEIEDFKEFLETHSDNNICTFIEGGDDPEEENVDWDNLTDFNPSPKSEYKNCFYQLINLETGEVFRTESTGLLIPGKKELTESDVNNFIEKLYDSSDIDDSFTNVSPLIDPYAELEKIRDFIAENRHSKLEVCIEEI